MSIPLAVIDNPSVSSIAERQVVWWLFLCCGLLLVMVTLGGITRLTQAGLSIVEWQPLSFLPPLREDEWKSAFTHYQKFSEYRLKNAGMALDDFKGIFWLEYIHRSMGRIIGVVFLVPLLWFLAKRKICLSLCWRLSGVLLLGILQGVMGWLMVKSGLADQPNVSQYRLVAHLGLALLIYALLLWIALGVLQPRRLVRVPLVRLLWGTLGFVTITLLSGGFVSGLDAGLNYNTFPMMEGQILPSGSMAMTPWYKNLFENVATVQFQHRLFAMTSLGVVLLLWIWSWTMLLPASVRAAMTVFTVIAGMQVALGILTLLLVVPIPLAVAHQSGAFILFTMGLVTIHLAKQ